MQLTNAHATGWHSPTDLFEASGPTAALFARRTGCEVALASLQTSIEGSIARFGATILAAWGSNSRAPPYADTTRVHVRIQDGWANINEAGHSNSAHTHGSAHVSGVVYIDAGNSTGGRSCTLLQNPAPGFLRNSMECGNGGFVGTGEDDICVPPVPGAVLLFPGWLPHAVLPHDGTQPRLSISFNADFVHPTGESATLGNSDGFKHIVNEASTGLKWMAAARAMGDRNDGKVTPMAWLHNAWARDAVVWTLSRLPLPSPEEDGASLSDIARGQNSATLSDESIAVTLHGLACSLTTRYSQALVAGESLTTSEPLLGRDTVAAETDLEPCDAWEFDYELLSMSAGTRMELPSRSISNTDGSKRGSETACDGSIGTAICGVVRLKNETPREVELREVAGDSALAGDVLVYSADPRPEYGFELDATDGETRFLYSLGLEARSVQESWSFKLSDIRLSQRVRLGHGEAVVLPCTSGLVSDTWVSSNVSAPVSVMTFTATRC
eukprot:COSAG02_NODE_2542_length_8571_cov_7.094429_2_plen_498_part_00